MSQFYIMEPEHSRSVCVADADLDIATMNTIFMGDNLPDEPIIFHIIMGRKGKDVIGTPFITPFIVSIRVIENLEKYNINGWDTFPIKIFDKSGEEICGYAGLSVVGRCGLIDDSKRKIEWRTSPYNENYRYQVAKGIYFAENSWDGSDIFATPYGGGVFIVNKVREMLISEKVKGFNFIDISDFEVDIPTTL